MVVLNSCSITMERFRIAFSNSYSLKFRNKALGAGKNCKSCDTQAIFYNFSTGMFLWHNSVNKGAI